MRKWRVSVAAICLSVGITACGSQTEKAEIADEAVALVENVVVESESSTGTSEGEDCVTEEVAETKESEELRIVHYEAKPEILEAKWYDGMIQFNDVLIQLPIRFNDLIALGFDYEIEGMAKDAILSDYTDYTVHFFFDGEKVFSHEVTSNLGDGHDMVMLNPEITMINIQEADLSAAVKDSFDIYIAGGMKMGDPATWVEEKYGKTKNLLGIDIKEYHYEMGFDAVVAACVYVDEMTQKITSYFVKNEVGCNNIDEMTNRRWYISPQGSLRFDYFTKYMLNWGSRYAFVEYKDNLYSFSMNATATTADLYIERVGELRYQATDDAGVYREIRTSIGMDGNMNGFYYCIIDGKKMINGDILIENMVQDVEEDYDAMFLETITNIVLSMEIE